MDFSAPLTSSNWKGKHVLILGLGQYPKGSGVAAAFAFARTGASLVVTDMKRAAELGSNVARLRKYPNVKFVFGRHRLSDVDTADLIVANPRVRSQSPEMRRARERGIPVVSDISLFLDRCLAPVIAVTGTRGKSTTSSLIAAMLCASGKRAWLGGNILVSPLTFLSKVKPSDVVVLELSSWQCESLSRATRPPGIAVVTNMMRDHLNAYEGMEDYAEAKAQIFRHQNEQGIVILNSGDAYGRRWMKEAPGIILRFGARGTDHAHAAKGELFLGKTRVIAVSKMKLLGEHNLLNAAAAALAAKVAGASLIGIRKALRSFKPLPHRLETVKTIRGVRYVNDTCATTPDGAIAAIRALLPVSKRLWMIVGGADKELEYQEFAKVAARSKSKLSLFVLPGDASKKIELALAAVRVPFERTPSVADAVREISSRAKKGDTVLLSPAAASFNQFKNEFERGEIFRKAVGRIG